MSSETTKLSDVINPQVMADAVSAKIPSKIVVTPFAAIDDTLQGVPGDSITVPQYATASTTTAKVKKAVKAVEITDEAKLSGYGDPEGEAVNQLSKSLASKMDADAMDAITGVGVQLKYDGTVKAISYEGIVDAVDVFGEEANSEKVIFVNPAQVTTLRKDANFISADKYGVGTNVVMTGEIGAICNCHVVPTKKVKKTTKTTESADFYGCPIVKLQNDSETEDDAAAVTVYMKRGVNLERSRDILAKKDVYSVDEHYTVALSNTAKVVLAKFKA